MTKLCVAATPILLLKKYRRSHARGMGDNNYAGPGVVSYDMKKISRYENPGVVSYDMKKISKYMDTDAENQNNAVGTGADNSINDPNWKMRKLKKGIKTSK